MIQDFLAGLNIPWFIQCAVCVLVSAGWYYLLRLLHRRGGHIPVIGEVSGYQSIDLRMDRFLSAGNRRSQYFF